MAFLLSYTMNEQTKIAFEFARDTVRQFITLATGLIALTITFAKDFISPTSGEIRFYALISWIFLLVSIIFGLFALMALTGTLGNKKEQISESSINQKNIAIPASMQILFFIMGLVFLLIFGGKSILVI